MSKAKKSLSVLLVLTLLLSLLPINVFAAESTTKIKVVAFNDFHGALVEKGEKDKNMGAAKLVQAIDEHKKANPNTIVLAVGDNFNGTAVSNLLYGEPVAKMFKEIGIAGSAVGNHEFDWDMSNLTKWTELMGAPFLAANIYDRKTNKPVEWAKPYIIEEFDGIKIAFIGLTTPETAYKTKPQNVSGLEFKDPTTVANEYVKIVKGEGADVVILLTHIGSFQNRDTKEITLELGQENLVNVKDIDGIIMAHSHQGVVGELNGVPIIQGNYNGRSLSTLEIEVNKKTKEVIKVTPVLDELYKRKAEVVDNEKMKNIINEYVKEVAPILEEVIGTTTKDLPRSKGNLSPLGQWTSEIMQKSAEAQVGLTNGGGIRTDLLKGNVTMGNMYEIMPFDNVLSIFNMTGAQLKEIFEYGIENKEIGWIQWSGVAVEYISGAEKGKKVVSMTLLENNKPVEMDKTYRVVTNDFMGTGGDGFTTFSKSEHVGDTIPIREAMVDAIREVKVLDFTEKNIAIPVTGTTEVIPTPEVKPEPSIQKYETHIVKSGDALWKIGRQYNVDWKKISDYNGLKNPNLIHPGQKLLIPVA